jgi:RNA polymerase sigma-70 factor (ECF subfamily)
MTAFARLDPPDRGLSAAVALPASMLPLRLVPRPHATVPTASTPTDAADAAREQRNRRLAVLLVEAAGGSAKAFEAFHDATCGMAQGVARRIVAVDAVDDVLVESYFQAWQQAARFDAERGSAASWLLAIVRSRALDLLRRERVRAFATFDEESADELADERPGPEALLAITRRDSHLHASLGKLSAQERCLLGLAFFRDLSHSQIAETTGLPLGTVKSAILRAQAKLRRDLAAAV